MISVLAKITGQSIIFPFYHSVSNEQPIHLKHLYRIKTIKEFEKDLDFLLKFYEPLSIDDIKLYCQNGKKASKNGFFLTFDDGLSQIFDIVSPILLRKGINATFFINPNFVDNKDLFFRFKASILLEKMIQKPSLKSDKNVVKWLSKSNEKNLEQAILSINYTERTNLDELAILLDIDFQNYLKAVKPYMTIEQIDDLVMKGFTIGGHSMDHPLYSDISTQEQIKQAEDSIQFVKKNWPEQARLFAFPFTDQGVETAFFDKVSYDLCFGTAGMKLDPLTRVLQRIPMENSYFSGEYVVKFQYLYFLLKAIFDKNIRQRND